MKTPKRLRWTFRTKVAAQIFADDKRDDGCTDIVIVEKRNQEDLRRDTFSSARVEGFDVVWTEYTSD